MAQYHSPENGYQLNVDSRYYSTLDIEGFSQMMKDPSCGRMQGRIKAIRKELEWLKG